MKTLENSQLKFLARPVQFKSTDEANFNTMAAATKLFLVLVALVCCMQLVELARLRRDAPATNPIDELSAIFQKATKDFTQTVEESTVLKEIKEKFSNISSDDVKKAVEEAGKNTKANLEKFEDFFKNVVDAVAKEMKHE